MHPPELTAWSVLTQSICMRSPRSDCVVIRKMPRSGLGRPTAARKFHPPRSPPVAIVRIWDLYCIRGGCDQAAPPSRIPFDLGRSPEPAYPFPRPPMNPGTSLNPSASMSNQPPGGGGGGKGQQPGTIQVSFMKNPKRKRLAKVSSPAFFPTVSLPQPAFFPGLRCLPQEQTTV